MSDDLVEFLRARLDEDEQVARAASTAPWAWHGAYEDDPDEAWRRWDASPVLQSGSPDNDVIRSEGEDDHALMVKRADAEHIALWDPARVLAEVEAKRAIVALWQTADTMFRDAGGGTGAFDDKIRFWSDRVDALVDTLRRLALPYDQHSDYRDEWKP